MELKVTCNMSSEEMKRVYDIHLPNNRDMNLHEATVLKRKNSVIDCCIILLQWFPSE